MTTKDGTSARYLVVDEIASGGMGAVFLALHTDENGRQKPVAIKKLHAHLAEDATAVDAFVDEARIAYRLRHPNVVRVHDVVPIDGQLVIVMDWVEGVALRALAKARSATAAGAEKLPIPVIRRLLVDALEGLHAAHELRDDQGKPLEIIHRDISPQNLLVGTDGLTRVTDFGIAMARGRLAATTASGGVKGKIPYLSPEQVHRSKVDRRSDLFAAGVVAWELLAGRRLFAAPSEGEIMAMILREPLVPPSTHRLDVPLDLDELVLKALERGPERRFATAADFARAIEEGGPVASHVEVGRIVAMTAGASLAARRQKLALAKERGAPARSLQEEMTATFVQPLMQTGSLARDASMAAHGVREGRRVSLPPAPATTSRRSLPPVAAAALEPPPVPEASARSTTPLLVGIVLALGLAIIAVVRSSPKPATSGPASFPAAPVIPPPELRGAGESAPVPTVPNPAVGTTTLVPVPVAPAPTESTRTGARPAHRPTSHGKRDAAAPRTGQPFMPDDL